MQKEKFRTYDHLRRLYETIIAAVHDQFVALYVTHNGGHSLNAAHELMLENTWYYYFASTPKDEWSEDDFHFYLKKWGDSLPMFFEKEESW